MPLEVYLQESKETRAMDGNQGTSGRITEIKNTTREILRVVFNQT